MKEITLAKKVVLTEDEWMRLEKGPRSVEEQELYVAGLRQEPRCPEYHHLTLLQPTDADTMSRIVLRAYLKHGASAWLSVAHEIIHALKKD